MVLTSQTTEYEKDKRLNDQEIISRYFTLLALIDSKLLEGDISYKKEINIYMSRAKRYCIKIKLIQCLMI